jgi:hypothetical protein
LYLLQGCTINTGYFFCFIYFLAYIVFVSPIARFHTTI